MSDPDFTADQQVHRLRLARSLLNKTAALMTQVYDDLAYTEEGDEAQELTWVAADVRGKAQAGRDALNRWLGDSHE